MMDLRANPTLAEQITAAFDWWRDAGVQCCFDDAAANWIAPAQAPASPQELPPLETARPEPAKVSQIERSGWPQQLTAFAQWWLSEPSLDGGRVADRVPPRGPAQPDLMIIVPEPEREDRDSLLSGPQGRLLDAMLAAMGLTREQVYLASVLPRHTPHADWDGMKDYGIGAILAHHISLVSPRRLVAFGSSILPLLGNGSTNSPENSRQFNHVGASVPLLADRDLGALLERPRWKAGFWQRWLDWA